MRQRHCALGDPGSGKATSPSPSAWPCSLCGGKEGRSPVSREKHGVVHRALGAEQEPLVPSQTCCVAFCESPPSLWASLSCELRPLLWLFLSSADQT